MKAEENLGFFIVKKFFSADAIFPPAKAYYIYRGRGHASEKHRKPHKILKFDYICRKLLKISINGVIMLR